MTKHPLDRKVFFVRQREEFLSLNEVRADIQSGKLTMMDFVFDVEGGSYTAGSIVQGKAPRWAMTAEHDPMLYDLPSLSEADRALVDELVSEEVFLEMPSEPAVKSVSHYLESEPRIARMVVDAERWTL